MGEDETALERHSKTLVAILGVLTALFVMASAFLGVKREQAESKVTNLKEQRTGLQEDSQALKQRISQLESQNATLRSNNAGLQAQLDDLKAKAGVDSTSSDTGYDPLYPARRLMVPVECLSGVDLGQGTVESNPDSQAFLVDACGASPSLYPTDDVSWSTEGVKRNTDPASCSHAIDTAPRGGNDEAGAVAGRVYCLRWGDNNDMEARITVASTNSKTVTFKVSAWSKRESHSRRAVPTPG